MDQEGKVYREFGVALRHADPRKTVILALHSQSRDDLVDHYAQLFDLKPLFEEQFALHLRGKRSRWRKQRVGAKISIKSA